MQFTPGDKVLVYAEQSGSRPVEIFKATSKGGSGIALTHLNDDIVNGYQLTRLERMTADGPEASKVESFIVKPPDFDPAKRYPVLFLIHGGPRGTGASLGVTAGTRRCLRRRLCGRDAESAGVHWLWTSVHQRGEWRLGWPRLSVDCGHGERGDSDCHTLTPIAWRRRRFLWRIHDRLDTRPQ